MTEPAPPLAAAGTRPSPLFWLGQFSYWGAFGLLMFVMLTGVYPLLPPTTSAVLWSTSSAMGLAASLLLHAVYRRVLADFDFVGNLGRVLLACVLVSVLWTVVDRVVLQPWIAASLEAGLRARGLGEVFRPSVSPPVAFAFDTLVNTVMLALWSGLYLGHRSRLEARSHAARALEARALSTQAQLQMLRYQLNPHFLFNALNSLQGLIAEDPARANRMVDEIAEFLRYSLLPEGDLMVPLHDEVRATRAYLAVEQVRFEQHLQLELEIGAGAASFLVPAFLLHPLVENAVKHGMRTTPLPLRVRIRARRHEGGLVLDVSNTGQWADDGGGGVGLENVRKRLAYAFAGRAALERTEEEGWVCIHVRIEAAPAPATGRPVTPEVAR